MITVLLVEDNVTLAYFAARNLRRAIAGLEVEVAGSCSEAANKAESLSPSVLVVDVELVDGSGIELASRLSERFPGMTTIVTSGKEPAGMEEDNAFGFLTKPYEAEALIEMVRAAASAEKNVVASRPIPKPTENLDVSPPGIDRHRIMNKLAGLLVGLRNLQGDLIAGSEEPAAVRRIAQERIDGLCGKVKEVSDLLSMLGR